MKVIALANSKKGRQIEAAKLILGFDGFRAAAKFLRECGWSLEAALFILLGK